MFFQAALLLSGKALTAGGLDGNHVASASAELYNPITNTWSAAGSLAMARAFFQMVLLADGSVLAAGGLDSDDNPVACFRKLQSHHKPLVCRQQHGNSQGNLPDGVTVGSFRSAVSGMEGLRTLKWLVKELNAEHFLHCVN